MMRRFKSTPEAEQFLISFCEDLGITPEFFICMLRTELVAHLEKEVRKHANYLLKRYKRGCYQMSLVRDDMGREIEFWIRTFLSERFPAIFSNYSNHTVDPDIVCKIIEMLGIEVKTALGNASIYFTTTTNGKGKKKFYSTHLLIKTYCPEDKDIVGLSRAMIVNQIRITDLCFGFLSSAPIGRLSSEEISKSFVQVI